MEEIKIGSAESRAPGVSKGFLKLADLPDGRPMQIPVVIVRGEKEGPTLWLHGCVHGNEYCGAYIIHSTLRGLDPTLLSGTVVALPVLNITAFQKNQRMSPYEGYGGGDLNRCFPGQEDGSLTQQMAYRIYTELRKHADYLIDFHTATLEGARFSKCDLSQSILKGLDLKGCDFSGATLDGANLEGANLGATDLRYANLIKAYFSLADLRKADLEEAKVSDDEISGCNILFGTTMPDGNLYDGRFNLLGDIYLARKEGIDPDNAEAMERFYAGDD